MILSETCNFPTCYLLDLIPAPLMTVLHRGILVLMTAENSAGELPMVSSPRMSGFRRTSGSARTRTVALDLANDRGRRVGRREQAEPRHRLESHSGIPPWSESRVPTCAADFAVVEAERRGEELP
jgi:hypothetical protein